VREGEGRGEGEGGIEAPWEVEVGAWVEGGVGGTEREGSEGGERGGGERGGGERGGGLVATETAGTGVVTRVGVGLVEAVVVDAEGRL